MSEQTPPEPENEADNNNEDGDISFPISLTASFAAEAASPYPAALEYGPSHTILKRPPVMDEDKPPLWLISFTDTVALMLTFFVMLYAMSVPELDKWNDMTDAVNEGLSRTQTMEYYAGEFNEISIEKVSFHRALDLGYLAGLIENQARSYENLEAVVILQSRDQLVISMPVEMLFGSGTAEVGIEGKRTMYILGGILNKIRNRIEVVGHTDPRPLNDKKQFGSNWELSLARAMTVASILKEVGYQRDIAVRGFSSVRYNEMVGTANEDGGRRVDIIIMKDDGTPRNYVDIVGSG